MSSLTTKSRITSAWGRITARIAGIGAVSCLALGGWAQQYAFMGADGGPGPRNGTSGWVDESGDLWMFAGCQAPGSWRNDLWKYSITGGTWSFVKGGTPDVGGSYGTQGVAADSNLPGARTGSVTWKDKNGAFWMFGGDGHVAVGEGRLNDLWKYSPIS